MGCVFCDIVKGLIPSKKVYEDEKILAFEDINPEAPIHIIIIPKKHVSSANDLNNDNIEVVSHIFSTIPKLAIKLNISESGYRVVNNCGKDGGQTVSHIHFHLLGGRSLQWPPG